MNVMKKKSNFILAVIFATFSGIIFSCSPSAHTTTATPEEITNSVDSSKWVFTPTNVFPQEGRTRQINGSYSVTYNSGKIEVYLPYFGRAYSGVGYGSNDNPLDFKTIDFSEEKGQKKDDQWTIVIKPNDYKEVQSMNFTLFTNGNANLDITLTNRSGIRFTGRVEPLNK